MLLPTDTRQCPDENAERPPFAFEVVAQSGRARCARLTVRRGTVETPAFMPVATHAAVKGIAPEELALAGHRILISNTYHLWLRPGADVVAGHGGLHAFMRWPGLIATDSGGFQAYSLASKVRLKPEGFEFTSHLDGSKRLLTPEVSIRLQDELGSDLAMQLDVCPAAGTSGAALARAIELTTDWARRTLAARGQRQVVFGIIQGGTNVALRQAHADAISALPFSGLALGGFSVGESPEAMYGTLREVMPHLDARRPHYLMGVGAPRDLLVAIGLGVDLFDCVLPTRNARNGQAYVDPTMAELTEEARRAHGPRLVIKNAAYKTDSRPLEAGCACPACAGNFSRSYLRHLFMSHEMLAYRLLTLHNLHFYSRLLSGARQAIATGDYDGWAERQLTALGYR